MIFRCGLVSPDETDRQTDGRTDGQRVEGIVSLAVLIQVAAGFHATQLC